MAEEKATMMVALMEVVKEATEAVPKFKESKAFADKVSKVVLDSY